jgi:2-oxoglutarate dehydrogenase E1 component
MHMTLTFNPSHLEWANPVVEGRVRAKQDRKRRHDARDACSRCSSTETAAFVGQGVVAETLNLSELRAYRTGGTVHVVINNQIGLHDEPRRQPARPRTARTSRACSAAPSST